MKRFLKKTYVHVKMRENLSSVLVPGDVRSRISSRNAQEGDFVSENVFIIKMRVERNLSSLQIRVGIYSVVGDET